MARLNVNLAALVGVLGAVLQLGCVTTSPEQDKAPKPYAYYLAEATNAAEAYVLIDEYSYAGVKLMDPVPPSAIPITSDDSVGIDLYRLSDIDDTFDVALLEVADGRTVGLTLIVHFQDEPAARRFFSAAYSVMAKKYSSAISPISDSEPGTFKPITVAYWSFSDKDSWITHVSEMNQSRAEMAWLYGGKPYDPPSGISDVLDKVSISLLNPNETRVGKFAVTVAYDTHHLRQINRDSRQKLIDSLKL